MEKKTKATLEGEVEKTQQIEEQAAKELAAKEAAEKEARAAEERAAKKAAEKAAQAAAKLAAGEKSGADGISKEGQRILADYPLENEVFMTSDSFGFFDEHDAIQHAKRLDDKDIVSVKRQEE